MEKVTCFLCQVSLKDRDCLRAHLSHEHGVVFNLDFVSRVAQSRTVNTIPSVPLINMNQKKSNIQRFKRLDPSGVKTVQVQQIPKIQEPVKMKLTMSPILDETVAVETIAVEAVSMSNGPDRSTGTAYKPVRVKPKNIRDKSNTYCDVCDVTMDTRLLFLEHCKSLHYVKFTKGKHCQPLGIPRDMDASVDMSRAEDSPSS